MEIEKPIQKGKDQNLAVANPPFFEVAMPESLLDYEEHAPHHWKLPPPQGQECIGTCMHCGIEKTFKNYPETEEREFQIKGKSRPKTPKRLKSRDIEERLPDYKPNDVQELIISLAIPVDDYS